MGRRFLFNDCSCIKFADKYLYIVKIIELCITPGGSRICQCLSLYSEGAIYLCTTYIGYIRDSGYGHSSCSSSPTTFRNASITSLQKLFNASYAAFNLSFRSAQSSSENPINYVSPLIHSYRSHIPYCISPTLPNVPHIHQHRLYTYMREHSYIFHKRKSIH